MRKLFGVFLIAMMIAFPSAAIAGGLTGAVQMDSNEPQEAPVIKGQTATEELSPPTWIKGKVFTSDDMLMYSYWQFPPFKKEFRWEIPSRKNTTLRLRPSVVAHWKGFKPDGECTITCVPMGEGKFRFYHSRADGPHGFLERVGETANGFPRYRYWFDEDPNTPVEKSDK